MRNSIIYTLAIIAVTSGSLSAAEDGGPPSFLILLADDVGWQDFGCYGNDAIHTPNIDQLATTGLRFTNAFLTTSSCSPTRISVLTGKYPHATGAEDLHMPLPADQTFVPTYLKQLGYFTGHMQKTHYGPNGNKQFDWYSKNLDLAPFLDECGDRPFFMWVGFSDAHRPYSRNTFDPPHDPSKVKVPLFLVDSPETRADLAMYYDEIARMDSNIGRMVEELKKRGRDRNTLVVFFSDNGMPFPRAKGTAYDSGVGTPLIAKWPAVIKPGQVHDGLASVVDLAPTWLEAAGAEIPSDMQGHSMLDRLRDPSLPGRRAVVFERNWHNADEHIRGVRTKQFKLIRNAYLELPFGHPSDCSSCPAWESLVQRRDRGELNAAQSAIFVSPRPEYELYDVISDPYELTNLASDPRYADVREQLASALETWRHDTDDFPATARRRGDNTNRVTGKKFTGSIPEMIP